MAHFVIVENVHKSILHLLTILFFSLWFFNFEFFIISWFIHSKTFDDAFFSRLKQFQHLWKHSSKLRLVYSVDAMRWCRWAHFFLIFYVHCKLILNTYSQTECKRFIKYSLNISKAHPSKYYIFSPLRWNTVNCSELCALQCMCIVHIYIYKFVPWMLLSRAEQLC